jgi:cob(I)alamin adenosyltransferase
LYNGERRSKSDLLFHALGNQDELNAAIGIAREYCAKSDNGLEEM